MPAPPGAAPRDLALMGLRGGAPALDVTAHASLVDGCIAIEGLPAGEYQLTCLGLDSLIAVSVGTQGVDGWVVAGASVKERTPPLPLVRGFAREGDAVVLRTTGASAHTRVHVLATRFTKDAVLPSSLDAAAPPPVEGRSTRATSQYVSGRNLGDEVRYVLERQNAPRQPGTMRDKPGLLLQPWALRATSTATETLAQLGPSSRPRRARDGRADAQGVRARPVRLEARASRGRAELPEHRLPRVRSDRARQPAPGRGRARASPARAARARAARPCDPGRPVAHVGGGAVAPGAGGALSRSAPPARARREEALRGGAPHRRRGRGAPIVVPDVRSGKIELLDTIARAHQLLLTLTGDASLRDFAFVTEWPSLDEPTRRARYRAYACHELNLFLWRKDPTFLTSVVRPYLAQRRDKTFVDRFLFGEDLCAFLEPWAFGKLSRRRWRASTHAWFRGSRAQASCATSTPRTRCRLRARAKP